MPRCTAGVEELMEADVALGLAEEAAGVTVWVGLLVLVGVVSD